VILAAVLAAAGIIAAGAVVAWMTRSIRGIRARLTVLALTGVVLPLAAVMLTGIAMLKTHDAELIVAVAGASCLAAVGVAIAAAAPLAHRLKAMSEVSERLAAGDLSARIESRKEDVSELRELATSFNEMGASLERLLTSRRNLVAWATHDLRAPLAALQAMVEAIQDGVGAPGDYLPEIRMQVRALARLVDDLFELSRIELGSLTLDLVGVSIPQIADGCIRSLAPAAEARGIRLRLVQADGMRLARCAPDKIERVLMNLLTNALRHTPHDGSVAVRISAAGTEVVVAVEDTGEGIPDGAGERVFESFWRGDASRSPATGGAGLGLAIARGLVEAQGGRIWAERRSEGGSRFVFTLPVA
jgi:signal transduction histidine kinase